MSILTVWRQFYPHAIRLGRVCDIYSQRRIFAGGNLSEVFNDLVDLFSGRRVFGLIGIAEFIVGLAGIGGFAVIGLFAGIRIIGRAIDHVAAVRAAIRTCGIGRIRFLRIVFVRLPGIFRIGQEFAARVFLCVVSGIFKRCFIGIRRRRAQRTVRFHKFRCLCGVLIIG